MTTNISMQPRNLGTLCTATVFLLLLAGCSSGNSSSNTTPTPNPTPTPTPTPSITSVYVIQNNPTGTSSILQFDGTDSGAVSPISSIAAPEHGAVFNGLAVDGSGNIYTAHEGLNTTADLREYAAGVTGAATTLRSLPEGSTTQIGAVDGIAASPTGEVFVAEDSGGIAAFSSTATGSVAPARYILGATQMGGGLSTVVVADAVAADAADNLYIVNQGAPNLTPIVVFGPAANGNVAPLRTLGGSATQIDGISGLTLDSAGNLYLASVTATLNGPAVTFTGSILVFAPGASGNVAPTRIIAGAATTLGHLYGIKVDSAGNIYVVAISSTGTSPTVLKFAANASGNVAPVSSFTSTAWTTIDNEGSLAVH